MNILIIGSKGFIGSHCVTYFAKMDTVWQCDVVTDYITKPYYLVDATNADYKEVFQSQTFDVCINCSGAASVPDSIINPQRDFMLNTVNVSMQLEAIRKYNPDCKYINLSSAAVYGNPQYLPIDELHPLQPISPYGVHKQMSETLCQSYHYNYNLNTCSVRIFSAFGKGLQKQLFWDLYQKAQLGTEVTLFGTGNETRDFIHINDIMLALDLIINKAAFNHDIFNLASGRQLSIKEVAETFYKQLDRPINIQFKGENRSGDPLHWVADITELERLGFKVQTSLEEGLKQQVAWLEESK
jgi:UDP-glucose 4-epimerase